MADNEKLFREEPVWKVLIKTSVPTVATMLIVLFYNIADIYFIGQTGDAMQVAALSLCAPVFSVMSAVSTLIGGGGCLALATAIGKKEYGKVKNMSAFCFYFGLMAGVFFTVSVLAGMKPVLHLLGTSEATAGYAKTYLMILVLGAPFIMLASISANVVRAEGAIKRALLGNAIGTVANIILDPLFITTLRMGAAGAAIATVLGNILAVLYFLHYFLKKSQRFSLAPRYFTWQKDVSLKVLSLGIPTTVGVLLTSFSNIITNNVLAAYGDIAIAAMGVASKLSMIVAMVQMAICTGIQPVLAYNFGAGNIKRFMLIIKKVGLTVFALGLGLTIVSYIGRDAFVTAFIDDPQVIEYGRFMVTGMMLAGPFIGLFYLTMNFLQTTTGTVSATIVSLMRQGIVLIPMIYLLNWLAGIRGIVFAHPIADISAAAAGGILCLRQYRNIVRD